MTKEMTAEQTEIKFYEAIREVENLASLLRLAEGACFKELDKLSPVPAGMEDLLGVMELAVKQASSAREMFGPVESYLRRQAHRELEARLSGSPEAD
jgi:hypothetical protein